MNTLCFAFEHVADSDLSEWIESKKACYKNYVDQYYGGWIDDVQRRLNVETFRKAMKMSYFRKITVDGRTVGFCGYDELHDRITGVTIHMYEHVRNNGIGSAFLRMLTECGRSAGKSIYLKVFKSNPARNLYERFNFTVYDETDSHYLMKCDC